MTTTTATTSNPRLWILGASDPEMEKIEALLTEHDEEFIHAKVGETRVHPGNAYKCDIPEIAGVEIYAVECIGTLPDGWVRVDHHRPGDPGFGVPPEGFFKGSSIGQVWSILTEEPPTEDILYAAAADHCLSHAYAGKCPGVTPEGLLTWRINSRSKFSKKPPEAIRADIEATRELIDSAPVWGPGIVSLLGWAGPGPIPELPEAGCLAQKCYLSVGLPDASGRKKLVCQGGSPEQIEFFLEKYKELGKETYGDPQRGFAGAYVD